jgi:hypothetical protein
MSRSLFLLGGVKDTGLPDHELVTPEYLGMQQLLMGAERGYHTANDILTRTVDGRDLNALWDEVQQTLEIWNARRQRLIDLLTYPVVNVIEDVPHISGDDFEEASQFGVPQSIRPVLGYFSMAYDFRWYDIATRFTWKFLADATAAQVEAAHQAVLEADNRLVFKKVMNTLFRNTNRNTNINQNNYTVFALYNGDGTVPPDYAGNTFDGNHTHYLVSGAAVIDSGDLDDLIEHLRHHGYSAANGTQLLLLANPAETKEIRRFRMNQANNNGAIATNDFVPATGAPPQILTSQGLLGNQPSPNAIPGMNVIGQYGPLLIAEEDYIPAGYTAIIGTGGDANLQNPIGIREHANVSLRGLRLVQGPNTNYPLQDSYYQRGFGTGIRQRGGAAILQIKAAGAYTIPALYNV